MLFILCILGIWVTLAIWEGSYITTKDPRYITTVLGWFGVTVDTHRFDEFHIWKFVFYLMIVGALILSATQFTWPHLIGAMLLGNFLFERTLDVVVDGRFFEWEDPGFGFGLVRIPYPAWAQAILGAAGLCVIIFL